MEPIYCSRKDGRKLLGIGFTLLDELCAKRVIQSVKLGNRRLLSIESIRRLADVGEAPR